MGKGFLMDIDFLVVQPGFLSMRCHSSWCSVNIWRVRSRECECYFHKGYVQSMTLCQHSELTSKCARTIVIKTRTPPIWQ
jgi:hypothetical protein